MEWARVRWPLGGLEWGMSGYALSEWAPPRSAALWIGASGWTVLVVAAAAVVTLLVLRQTRREPSVRVASVVTLLMVLMLIGGSLWSPQTEGELVRVAVVQGNNPCPGEHCPNER